MAVQAPSPVFPSGASTASAAKSPTGAGSSVLGQADFMKLLMAQMQNQDPLNPTNATDFSAQLAQFSSLQGVQQLNSSFNQMLMLQQVSQGANLIGKQITYTSDGKSLAQSGIVTAVQITNGNVQLMVGNQAVALSQVTSIATAGNK